MYICLTVVVASPLLVSYPRVRQFPPPHPTHLIDQSFLSKTVIRVAEQATLGIQHIAHRHIGQQSIHIQHRVQRHGRRARRAVTLAGTIGHDFPRAVGLLPAGQLVIDKEVVHEEDRVAGRSRDLGHDGPNAVVGPGVWSEMTVRFECFFP